GLSVAERARQGKVRAAPGWWGPCANEPQITSTSSCLSATIHPPSRRDAPLPKLKLIPDRRGRGRVWRGGLRRGGVLVFLGPHAVDVAKDESWGRVGSARGSCLCSPALSF